MQYYLIVPKLTKASHCNVSDLTNLYRSLVHTYWQDHEPLDAQARVIVIQTLFSELQECWERTTGTIDYMNAHSYPSSSMSTRSAERYICNLCACISDPSNPIHGLFWDWAAAGGDMPPPNGDKSTILFVMKSLRNVSHLLSLALLSYDVTDRLRSIKLINQGLFPILVGNQTESSKYTHDTTKEYDGSTCLSCPTLSA